MSKHTPGPWRFRGLNSIFSCDGEPIAFVRAEHRIDINGLIKPSANAQLIAAAPQMLEALEAVAPLLHWLDQEQGVNVAGDALPKILAAIAAAKGEV